MFSLVDINDLYTQTSKTTHRREDGRCVVDVCFYWPILSYYVSMKARLIDAACLCLFVNAWLNVVLVLLENRRVSYSLPGHASNVNSMSIRKPHQEQLLSISANEVYLWDLKKLRRTYQLCDPNNDSIQTVRLLIKSSANQILPSTIFLIFIGQIYRPGWRHDRHPVSKRIALYLGCRNTRLLLSSLSRPE